MKRFLSVATTFLLIVASLMTACGSTNPSDTSYWFSEHSESYVKYSEKTGEDDYGTFWDFTSAKTCDITFNVKLDVGGYSSTAYLFVNDVQVKSETNTGLYSFVYKLSLKRGDKIKLRAFNTLAPTIDEKRFEILLLAIENGGNTFLLTEFDKSEKV